MVQLIEFAEPLQVKIGLELCSTRVLGDLLVKHLDHLASLKSILDRHVQVEENHVVEAVAGSLGKGFFVVHHHIKGFLAIVRFINLLNEGKSSEAVTDDHQLEDVIVGDQQAQLASFDAGLI